MPTPTDLPDTPYMIPGNTRPNAFGTGVAESTGINEIIDNVGNAWVRLGVGATTPDAAHKTLKATADGDTEWGYHALVKLAQLSGSAASFDFTSIPQTFQSLRLVVAGRGDTAATSIGVNLRFNNDSGSNYDWQRITATDTTPAAFGGLAASSATIGALSAASSPPDAGGSTIIDIPNYVDTTFQKTAQGFTALKTANSGGGIFVGFYVGFWRSAAAISRVTLLPNAGNFAAGTVATLYGLPA